MKLKLFGFWSILMALPVSLAFIFSCKTGVFNSSCCFPSTGQLVSEEVQDGPSGRHPGSVPPLLHFSSGHDDQDLLPVWEDQEGQRAALPAAVAVGDAVSVWHSWRRGGRSAAAAPDKNSDSSHFVEMYYSTACLRRLVVWWRTWLWWPTSPQTWRTGRSSNWPSTLGWRTSICCAGRSSHTPVSSWFSSTVKRTKQKENQLQII